ncbi:hypothetical protein MK805_07985 [Shimazuella sp. AN120528]|uniref:hypothetical protein n=1 Tax=Shimazuella soli TaxID=1892854 RepID=UPI001F0CFDB4|nr:hypothetical protein [Shimazuella soli]MCH5584912.1 hypothetical protein [Shimazuella soli]
MARIRARDGRDYLLKLAKKLGVPFDPTDSNERLRNLINDADATKEQMEEIADLLKRVDRKCPEKLKYGQAEDVLKAAKEFVNQHTINAMGLEERKVIEWRQVYFYIKRVFGQRKQYRIVLQRVALSRPSGEENVTFTPIGDSFVINPNRFLYLANVVDLDKWKPDVDIWASSEEEPDWLAAEIEPDWSSSDEDPPF